MIKRSYFLLIILLSSLFIVSCEKDETEVINESEVLAAYLESTASLLQKDYVNSDMPSIMSAEEVKTLNATNQVYILDIRSAADFATGHITNAHNVALADILTHIEGVNLSTYTKVAVVCYTGQTAGFATTILRIMGYDKAFSMKWGMCSWHSDFAGRWNTTIASGNAYASQFTSDVTPKAAPGDMPVLSTGKTTGEEILKARVAVLLAEGFTPATVNSQTLFGNLPGYYIVNYWPAAQYTTPGHIPGAIQYTPKESIKLATDLKTLPTDKPVAVYCYTGQTSAFLAAYLRLLGYDAKSVLYGANSMIYDNMVTNQMTVFGPTQIKEYTYE